jgi:hypothetical protein
MQFFMPSLMTLGQRLASGYPVPTLLPEGEGIKSPLPLGEG